MTLNLQILYSLVFVEIKTPYIFFLTFSRDTENV